MDGYAPLEQLGKPFLREVIIMRKDFGDPFLPHHEHRDAICQAVAFVRAGFVEGKAVQKRLVGLLADDDAWVGQNAFDKGKG